MGGSGSITLGYIVGFIVIDIFFAQRYGVAISILAYMFCDCTFSLIKKMKKGYMPWIGLYDYYYLIPVLKNKKNHLEIEFYEINEDEELCLLDYYKGSN